MWMKPMPSICIHYDSKLAIGRAQSHMYKVSLDIFVKDIYFIKSKENIANPLTKSLSREQVNCSSKGMGLKPMT